MGGGDTRGGAWGGGPWGDRRPGDYYTSDDVRQFRGEARRWLGEAQALRNMLREQGVDPKELDEIMRRMRELDSDRVYKDVEELARLQSFVAEGIKRFEYNLRRQAGDEADRAIVAGAEDVPPEFRTLVEEYYRSLSKGRTPEMRRLVGASLVALLLATSMAEAQRGLGARLTGAGAVKPGCRRATRPRPSRTAASTSAASSTPPCARSSAAWAGAPTIPSPTSTSRSGSPR